LNFIKRDLEFYSIILYFILILPHPGHRHLCNMVWNTVRWRGSVVRPWTMECIMWTSTSGVTFWFKWFVFFQKKRKRESLYKPRSTIYARDTKTKIKLGEKLEIAVATCNAHSTFKFNTGIRDTLIVTVNEKISTCQINWRPLELELEVLKYPHPHARDMD
jgi:hypothetical protein